MLSPVSRSGTSRSRSPQPFHILSFEGPDAYARAGGIASRVTGLTDALSKRGHPVDLWFVGDPNLPGHEQQGLLGLHRWCQWISQYHPAGTYDGEDGKVRDYAASLPPYLLDVIISDLQTHPRVVVLAEEWHTVDAVLHLDALLRTAKLRERVDLLWNANNTFGFQYIDWSRLKGAATVMTVSRYMRQLMAIHGVEAVVVPNGLAPEAFRIPSPQSVRTLRAEMADRLLLTKVARWDPDKRWLLAMETVAELKQQGARPILIARGGMEGYGGEVQARARALGLRLNDRRLEGVGEVGLLRGLRDCAQTDVVLLASHLDPAARATLFQGADAVLANSGHEPFGLVGLETMAVGGLACTGASGEDYCMSGQNALMLQRDDPREFGRLFAHLRARPGAEGAMRRAGQRTAERFLWSEVVERDLLPWFEDAPFSWQHSSAGQAWQPQPSAAPAASSLLPVPVPRPADAPAPRSAALQRGQARELSERALALLRGSSNRRPGRRHFPWLHALTAS